MMFPVEVTTALPDSLAEPAVIFIATPDAATDALPTIVTIPAEM
jgi:hypothetical protein